MTADLERLLRDARGVPRLARRLCADAALADDLAQDAWVAAIERPPRDADAGRAWFSRVLANLARQRGRSESARRARERSVARREAQAEDVVARAETSRRLVGAVLALDEPYRSTLLARFFDDLEPAEIARRTGVNASTVRTRLERGIALLRERLEREGGRAWLGALAPLAAPASSAPFAKFALTTGIAMTTATKIGIALAGALALTWFAWTRAGDPEPETAAAPAIAASEASDPVAPRREPTDASERRAEPSTELAQSATPAAKHSVAAPVDVASLASASEPGFLEGIVLRGATPVDGGTLWYWRGHWRPIPVDPVEGDGDVARGALMRAPIGRDGRFRVGPLGTDWYTLAVDAGSGVGAQTFVQVDADAAGRVVVIVLGTARVEGRVWHATGAPAVGAAVRLSTRMRGNLEMHARTDASGRYSIADLDPQAYWASLDLTGRTGVEAALDDMRQIPPLEDGETRVVDFGSPDPGVRWRGRLVLRDGSAVPHGYRLGWKAIATGAYTETPIADAQPFELLLKPGAYELQATLTTTTAGHGTEYLRLGRHEVGAVDFERDLVVPGTTVEGSVRGIAISDVPRSAALSLQEYPGQGGYTAEIGPDGRFRFVAVPPGRYRVLAGPKIAVEPETTVDVREGDASVSVDVSLVVR